MREEIIQNAKVKSIRVGYQRDETTFLGFDITFDYGGSAQGFGGYTFDQWDEASQKRIAVPEFGLFFQRILDVFDIAYIDQLKGQVVRVKRVGKNEWNAFVRAFGHPLKDEWVDIRDFFPDDEED